MPNRSKGPRLHLRPARGLRKAHWVILDTGRPEKSTGCGEYDIAGAERALEQYLAGKRVTGNAGPKDPAQVPVADVIALYGLGPAKETADPKWTAARLANLLEFFGSDTLASINGGRCREFASWSSSDTMARRELEVLRAAINHHRREGHCDRIVSVVLPARRPRRERWLTRSEVALLVWTAWSYRELQKGKPTDKRPRQHTAKFMLVAFYTGRRAGAICAASFYPSQEYGYVDLERGVLYARRSLRISRKRQTPQPLPDRLLAHLRRWKAKGQRFVVEWDKAPVKRVTKSHNAVVRAAKLEGVTPHTWRHTAATHLMQRGVPMWEAAGYLAMTEKQLEDGYGHHHPDFMALARGAFGRKV